MIEARGLTKAFGGNTAVSDVTFSIAPGEIVGFLGPNGAGKSTTMRMLAGLIAPDKGSAAIDGIDVAAATTSAQSRLGYMPEACAGFADLTVREFLTYCADARGLRGKDGVGAVSAICMDTALASELNTVMRKLSKGWRQRAWFAQSVLHRPPALILDEPTDGLDPGQKEHIRRYIKDISQETAVILSTHILEEAEAMCSRAIIIANGTVLADEPIRQLLDRKGRLAPAFHELTSNLAAA